MISLPASTPRRILLLAGAVSAMVAVCASAQAAENTPADTNAVASCLEKARKTSNEGAPLGPGAGTSQPAPDPDAVAKREDACIGVAANKCLRTEGDSTAAMIHCYSRENDVWDARLNAAYKKALATSEPDVAEGYRKIQRAWIVYRDATCAQPHLIFKGTMAGPAGMYCTLDLTARQSLSLERWMELR